MPKDFAAVLLALVACFALANAQIYLQVERYNSSACTGTPKLETFSLPLCYATSPNNAVARALFNCVNGNPVSQICNDVLGRCGTCGATTTGVSGRCQSNDPSQGRSIKYTCMGSGAVLGGDLNPIIYAYDGSECGLNPPQNTAQYIMMPNSSCYRDNTRTTGPNTWYKFDCLTTGVQRYTCTEPQCSTCIPDGAPSRNNDCFANYFQAQCATYNPPVPAPVPSPPGNPPPPPPSSVAAQEPSPSPQELSPTPTPTSSGNPPPPPSSVATQEPSPTPTPTPTPTTGGNPPPPPPPDTSSSTLSLAVATALVAVAALF